MGQQPSSAGKVADETGLHPPVQHVVARNSGTWGVRRALRTFVGVNSNKLHLNSLNRDLSICSGNASSIHPLRLRPGYLCLACSSARCSSSWVEEQRRNWLRNSVVPRFLCTQLRLQQHDSQTGAELVYATNQRRIRNSGGNWSSKTRMQPQPRRQSDRETTT